MTTILDQAYKPMPIEKLVNPDEFRKLALQYGWQEKTIRLLLSNEYITPATKPIKLSCFRGLPELRVTII